MIPSADHLIIAPILIPFVAGALMLLYDERRRRAKLILALIATGLMLLAGIALLRRANGGGFAGGSDVGFYLLGNWAVPWGIVLVLDRLSALMVVLNGLLAFPILVYAGAGWHRRGQHFMSLMMFLFMGLNGAFLTGDLFSLFVFFEVLLAASYGLLLHGGGQFRVRAGLHYVAINLAGSVLFLIGVALIYGAAGTLSMAHLSQLMVTFDSAHRPLIHAGAALMGLAFLVKAGIWPLSFWLPSAYMASPAPVAAMFAIMTKVGVYILMRLSFLTFGASAGESTGFGAGALMLGGMATMVYGTLGILGSQGLGRMAAHVVLVSSGTLLAVTGIALGTGAGTMMLSGALYYLVSSTLAAGMLFLLFEPMSREEGGIAAMLALTTDAWGLDPADTEEDADPAPGLQLQIPGLMTALAVAYAVAVLALSGLPPLSGFVGKFVILLGGIGDADMAGVTVWIFAALLIVAGFATLIGLMRIGIQTFWANDGEAPPISVLEAGPVIALSVMLVLLTVQAEDVLRFTGKTAEALGMPTLYVEGVLSAPPVPDTPDAPAATAGDAP